MYYIYRFYKTEFHIQQTKKQKTKKHTFTVTGKTFQFLRTTFEVQKVPNTNEKK